MFCWQTGEARDLAGDLDRFSSLSRVIVAIPPQSVFPVTSLLFVLFGRGDLGKSLPRGFLPLHRTKDTFPPFSAVNKEWLFSGFSYQSGVVHFLKLSILYPTIALQLVGILIKKLPRQL